jgi:hypothetical protein
MRPAYFFTPDLERAINQLEGVTSSRVLSTSTEIDEIHVLALPSRSPKKLVRDIESLLLVLFGIRVDHRKISIVPSSHAPVPPSGFTRPKIQKVERVDGSVCIHMRVGPVTIEGSGRANPGESELYAGSRALINAIEHLMKTEGLLELQDIETLQLHDHEIVLAILSWSLDEQEEVLVGTSVSRAEPIEAAARATLDAINRKLVRIQANLVTDV